MDLPVWRTDLDEVDSTNSYCLRELALGSARRIPWLVVAAQQTAGRGRGEHQWWAGKGALTFSLVIDTVEIGIPTQRQGLLSLATGLAICEAIEAFYPSLRLQVKWPNDVYLHGRKLGGILIEATGQNEPFLVVGVGINTHNTLHNAPHEIQQRGISLADVVPDLDDNHLLENAIVQSILRSYLLLGRDDDDTIAQWRQRWQSRSMLDRREVIISRAGHELRGVCLGTDDLGGLVLQTSSGRQIAYAGSVRLVEEQH